MSDTMQGPPAEDVAPASESGNRRLLLLVVAAAAVLVLGAATYFLFLSGGSDDELGPVTSAAPAAPQDTKEKAGNDKKNKLPPKADKSVNVGRDPFQPLAAEAPVVTEEETTGTTGATGGTTGTTGGNAGDDPNATSDSTYTLTLLSTNPGKNTAEIDIDGKTYSVSTNDVFPSKTQGPFKLVKVEAGKVKVVFGSDIPVILKTGTAVDFFTV